MRIEIRVEYRFAGDTLECRYLVPGKDWSDWDTVYTSMTLELSIGEEVIEIDAA